MSRPMTGEKLFGRYEKFYENMPSREWFAGKPSVEVYESID